MTYIRRGEESFDAVSVKTVFFFAKVIRNLEKTEAGDGSELSWWKEISFQVKVGSRRLILLSFFFFSSNFPPFVFSAPFFPQLYVYRWVEPRVGHNLIRESREKKRRGKTLPLRRRRVKKWTRGASFFIRGRPSFHPLFSIDEETPARRNNEPGKKPSCFCR